jgi:hypothetical protein
MAMYSISSLTYSLQLFILIQELLFALAPRRIKRYAGYRTDLLALRLAEVTDAFSAFIGINLINLQPHENRFIGALWLAYVAIYTIIRDYQCHDLQP